MERGEKTVGSFFESGSTAALEMMGLTGLDYVVIDTEHGPFDAERAGEFVCAAERHNLTRYTEIVEYGKYYPLGERGVAGERANCFTYDMGGSLNDWFRIANEETLLIPQCETVGCLKDIDNIVRVDGIAGMFVGPYDLSTAMGIPGQFDNPDFLKAIQKVVDACHAAGKFCITYCDSAQKARQYWIPAGGQRGAARSMTLYPVVHRHQRILLRRHFDY